MNFERQWVPILKVSAPSNAVAGCLVGAKNQAGKCISVVADPRQIAPRASRIARVHTDAVAVNAAQWFAGYFLPRRPPSVAQNELVGSERNGFANIGWREAVRECCGCGFCGL